MITSRLATALLTLAMVTPSLGLDTDAMRQKMLGEWEIIYDRGGYVQRNVKAIDDTYETMSIYVDERLVQQWRCKWELEPRGDFAVYRFAEFETLKGARVFRPGFSGSYLLRVTDNAWYEMVRMEAEAEGEPRFDAFRRVGSDPRVTGALGVSQRAGPLAPNVTPGEGRVVPSPAVTVTVTDVEPPREARPWQGSEAEWFDTSDGDAAKQHRLEPLALGVWRCEREDGTVIEKLVAPGAEVVRLKRDGEPVRIWKTEWQIRVKGGVAQLLFRNYQLLEGERTAPDGLSGGYALSIVGDTWTEVSGMIGRAPSPPTLNTFKRIAREQAGG